MESATATELRWLGATDVRISAGGVHFAAGLPLLYRALLRLRTANRVLRPLREFAAINPEMLYSQTRRVRWEDFLNPTRTLAVYATIEGAGSLHKTGSPNRNPDGTPTSAARQRGRGKGQRTGPVDQNDRQPSVPGIRHTQYAALKIKDAIVDRLRREQGARPNVDTKNADVRVYAHFAGGRCTLSLDACGASLHERGYRTETGEAPLKETLASAIIDYTGWDGQTPLCDPMCGSGTLLIEAALKAARRAPGLWRPEFACQRWPDFDANLWQAERDAAQAQKLVSLPVPIIGGDCDPRTVAIAESNARSAGVEALVQFSVRNAEDWEPPAGGPGTLVVNPPYGNRIGDPEDLGTLYHNLGETWKARFRGWKVFVLAGNLNVARSIDLQATEKIKLHNGPLECRLLRFEV